MSLGRLVAVALAALALAAGSACGGGGGGGGGGGPTPPPPGIAFTGASVGSPSLRLVRGGGSSGTVLELQLQADGVPEIFGLAFDLTYPAAALRFESFAEGSFLGRNGAATSLQVAEPNPGRLVVGHSRLGDVGTVGGSGVLMTLRFTAAGAGSGSLSFDRNRLFDARGDEVRGPAWGGGTVQVSP